MNIDEISKLALKIVQEEELKEEIIQEENLKENNKTSLQSQDYFTEKKQEENDTELTSSTILKTTDKLYLNKIKERILVLFEALKNADNDSDLNKRLDLTIEFIQFLLAHIDEQLDKD